MHMKNPKIKTTLCKLDKHDIEESMDDIVSVVSEPKFICQQMCKSCRQIKSICASQ